MAESPSSGKRLYVLDTNVLMHDPMALFRFKEQDVFLPMVVLEELDAAKKGMSEVARNVRQVSRFLDELIVPCDPATIQSGIPLRAPHGIRTEEAAGRLLVQTGELQVGSPLRNNQAPDNQILNAALALTEKYTDTKVVLVSKDINLRIRAAILGRGGLSERPGAGRPEPFVHRPEGTARQFLGKVVERGILVGARADFLPPSGSR